MNRQLTIFNGPRSRRRDPVTSVLAAAAVAPAAGLLELRIVEAVAGGPRTAEQIAFHIGWLEPNRWIQGTIVTAVSRCAKRGLLVENGTGLTSRGRTAVRYERAR